MQLALQRCEGGSAGQVLQVLKRDDGSNLLRAVGQQIGVAQNEVREGGFDASSVGNVTTSRLSAAKSKAVWSNFNLLISNAVRCVFASPLIAIQTDLL